jgi:fused signal recognition particle receptor
MGEMLVSFDRAQEILARFLGAEQVSSAVWVSIGLACCVLLLFYLSVRYVVTKRKEKAKRSDRPPRAGTVGGEYESLPDEGSVFRASLGGSPDENAASGSIDAGMANGLLSTEPLAGEQFVPPSFREEPAESLLTRLRGRLTKTHDQLIGRLDQILLRRSSVEQDFLEDLEEVLITADLGVRTTYELLGAVQQEIKNEALRPLELKATLRQKIRSILEVEAPAFVPDRTRPFVIMVAGVNGVGKTTSIGKLAAHLKGQDRKVMLVAADTFRAAAIEQLQIWSDRVGADFVRHKPGSDPSAVVYDAMQAAKSRDTDLVIVDTAGRLHTKANLMEELKKVKRIMGRELEGAPHETLLVVDATTGQNAINQARSFHEALGVTGIILTKLDGTAKGGVIVGIAHELRLPVRFIGIGEGVEDLRAFDAQLFLEAVFAEPGNGGVH